MEALADGEIVWVKVSNSWWPGEVMGEERLSEEFFSSLRKKPLAVVKFFQEDTYEYVKNPSFIFKYNCPRKGEFLRKGLEQCRAKKKHMETFPEDVMHAERMTGGDPDIVNSTDFLPQKKERYSGLFQEPRSPSSKGKSNQKEKPVITTSTMALSVVVRKPAHEVRFLPQTPGWSGKKTSKNSEGGETPNVLLTESAASFSGSKSPLASPSAQLYHCYKCNYSANRQNLIVLHMKHCRASGVADKETPTRATLVSPPARSNVVARKILPAVEPIEPEPNDSTDEEESKQKAVMSAGRSRRSLIVLKQRKLDIRAGRTPKQARIRLVQPPKKTTATGNRRNRRLRSPNNDNEELFLDDTDAGSFVEIGGETGTDDVELQRMESEEKSSSKLDSEMVEAEIMGKKSKTDVKLKKIILADWSEDEQEDEGEGVIHEGDQTEEHVVSTETSCSPKDNVLESNDEEAVHRVATVTKKHPKDDTEKRTNEPVVQKRTSSSDTGRDKTAGCDEQKITIRDADKESVNDPSPSVLISSMATAAVTPFTTIQPVISPCTTIKYRNIPKKQKREFIEVTNDDVSTVPSREGSTASSSSTTTIESLGNGAGTAHSSTTHSVRDASERPISAKQLILNRATRGSSKSLSGDETAMGRTDDAGRSSVEAKVAKDSSKEDRESQRECESKNAGREASCFDFNDDEEDGKQETLQFSSITPPSRRSGSVADRKQRESGRKTSAMDDEVASAPENNALGNVAETEQETDVDRDAQLSQEIDSLLCETKLPKFPDRLNELVEAVDEPVPSDKIRLPPKERGKRIFKTRNQIPSVTSSETFTEDVNEAVAEEESEEATAVSTTDAGLANSSSVHLKSSSTKGRRGKKKTAAVSAPVDAQLHVLSKVASELDKGNKSEQKADPTSIEKEQHQERTSKHDVVEISATKKRKSNEPYLPDSSGGSETLQASTFERKKGRKRKEPSNSDEVGVNSNCAKLVSAAVATSDVTESGRSKSKIFEEGRDVPTPVSIPAAPAAVVVVEAAQSTAANVSSMSINPRKRHIRTGLVSSEVVSTQNQEPKIRTARTSTDAAHGSLAASKPTVVLAEKETHPSIPEKKKRDSATAQPTSEPSAPTEQPLQQSSAVGLAEDEKFDIDNMPIVIGDNGLLVNEVILVEQPKPLAVANPVVVPSQQQQHPLPSNIAVVKGVNGSGGNKSTTTGLPAKIEGLFTKAPKEKRPTTVATMKGGTSQELIVITSKGTVLTTSSQTVSVNSKLSSKSTITVTSAITIGTGGRNASAMSATTSSLVPRRGNLVEQPESSLSSASSTNGQRQHASLPWVAEGACVSTMKKVLTAAPSSSSSISHSSPPKKTITKKLLHGDTTMSSSTSSSSSSSSSSSGGSSKLHESNNERRLSGDGASSSVSSSSSASTSPGSGTTSETIKKNTRVMKVTPQKMKEFSRLGYIEDRGKGKILTPSGMRKFKQELQQQQQEEKEIKKKPKPTQGPKSMPTNVVVAASGGDTSSSASSTVRQSVAEVASSGNVVVAAAADSSVQEFVGQVVKKHQTLVTDADEADVNAANAVIVETNADDNPIGPPVDTPAASSGAAVECSPISSATEVILGTTEASSSNGSGAGASGVQEPSQLIAVPAENFGGPPNLFYLCSVRDESLIPVNNELLYLDSSNQLVALPEQQQQQHSAQQQAGQPAEVIMPTGSNNVVEVGANALTVGTTLATAGCSDVVNIVEAASSADGTQQSFLLDTQDGQQIILDQQSLMALAAGGDTPQLLTADGQQILLQETAQEWLAALSASQQVVQQQPGSGTLSTLVTPEGTQIIVAHENTGLIELQEHPVLLPADIIQVNPNTTIETNAVLTKPPIMSTVEVPSKNGLEPASIARAGRTDRRGFSGSSSSRAAGEEGSPPSRSSSAATLSGTANLDESLAAVIGHVPSNPHVPTSLELPITVTNPAIAKTTTTSSRLNPPLFPVTTIATTVPSPSDMLSSATTVVLVAADQATAAVAGTIDDPTTSLPSSPSPSPLSTATEKLSSGDSTENVVQILISTGKKRKLPSREELIADVDVDDIQIPNTPESQQNSEQQIGYDFSDNEDANKLESNDHSGQTDEFCDQAAGNVAPSDLEDGNSNCSEIIPLQPNVVILDDGMLPNNAANDGIEEESDNDNDTDDDVEERRHSATLNNNQHRETSHNNVGQQEQMRLRNSASNRNGTDLATGPRDANIAERHSNSNNITSGVATNMNVTIYDSQAGNADERGAGRSIVER